VILIAQGLRVMCLQIETRVANLKHVLQVKDMYRPPTSAKTALVATILNLTPSIIKVRAATTMVVQIGLSVSYLIMMRKDSVLIVTLGNKLRTINLQQTVSTFFARKISTL
jgi:hypothetical protein